MPTPEKHALLSASSAERWLNCTPSARLAEDMPDKSTQYTEAGRLAHAIAELKLRKQYLEAMGPRKFTTALNKLKADPHFAPEMLSATDEYMDFIADMDFVREASMRCDYLLATLNPDDPGLPVYEEYINHSRPMPEWENDTPREILELLNREPKQGWVHWFFSFEHNAGLSTDKVEKIISMVPPGTKLYKNKILGLRGRATGLVFNLEDKSLITVQQARQFKYLLFTAGLDTAYSQNSADTFAFTFWGVTTCRRLVGLDVRVYNNRDLSRPLTPSDIPPLFEQFLEANRSRWGFARDAFIDSADQATLLECRKYKQLHGSVYNYLDAWKKTKIIDRINLQAGWMAQGYYLLVREACRPLIDELNVYSWKEDKYEPEDGNDHCINSGQYAWLPFKDRIGGTA